MYSVIKSCVSLDGDCSAFFYCKKGLRQGGGIYHTYFFLNDLESFLLRRNNFGLNIFDDSLQCYLKLVVLLYTDDIVLTWYYLLTLFPLFLHYSI